MKRLVRKSVFEPQFLVLFMLLLAVKIEAERCQGPGSSGITMPFHQKHADVCMLQKDVVLEKTYNSPTECGLKCLQDPFCAGYNYRKEQSKKNSNCQLTHKLDNDFGNCNKSDKKWTFYQAAKKREVPCNKIKNCKNGGKTVISQQDPSSNPYRCECQDGYTGELCDIDPNTCAGLYNSGERKDGVYTINRSNEGLSYARCDMTSDGGGWTVFQRRLDGSVDFYRGWHYYKAGFGTLYGEFWLGLDKIHRLTKSGQNVLRVDLTDFNGTTAYAKYGTFTVASESDGYRLNVGSFSGTAGDSLNNHNGMKFTTKDRDNDQSSSNNCAVSHKSGWWYNSCYLSNLNGEYLAAGERPGEGISWFTLKYDWRTMKKAEMKIRPAQF